MSWHPVEPAQRGGAAHALSRGMNHLAPLQIQSLEVLVLVADSRGAKLLVREPDGTLKERWSVYSPSDRIHGLSQSPDTRELTAPPETPECLEFAKNAFAADLSDRLRDVSDRRIGVPIVVIAPQHFGDALRAAFGPAFWKRVKSYVPRDEIGLSDQSLQRLVDETLVS